MLSSHCIVLHCTITNSFLFFLSYNNTQFEVSAKVSYIQACISIFHKNKYASLAEVLKFYITEVVVRQSEDGECTMPQNRQVLLNSIYNTPKFCQNVFKSGVTHLSPEV